MHSNCYSHSLVVGMWSNHFGKQFGRDFFKSEKGRPDAVAQACNLSTLGGWVDHLSSGV